MQSCCRLGLSLWVVADGSARAKTRKRKMSNNGKLERSEPFTGTENDRASFSIIHDDEWSEKKRGWSQQTEPFKGACCAIPGLSHCFRHLMGGWGAQSVHLRWGGELPYKTKEMMGNVMCASYSWENSWQEDDACAQVGRPKVWGEQWRALLLLLLNTCNTYSMKLCDILRFHTEISPCS